MIDKGVKKWLTIITVMIKLSQKGFVPVAGLVTLFILVLGIVAGLYLSQNQQTASSRAGSDFNIAGFQRAYGSKKGDPNFDPQYDANNDGVVNILDFALLQPRFLALSGGRNAPSLPKPSPTPQLNQDPLGKDIDKDLSNLSKETNSLTSDQDSGLETN